MPSYFIGYSNDKEIRYKGSSGGIGTAVLKYLLSKDCYGTAMTFVFNEEKCLYEPKLIYDFDDYNNCGSIYQDVDIVEFLKNNLDSINGGMVVTCMPCQVKPIRRLLNEKNIRSFIICLCCSGQTNVEGTWHYYKMLGVKKEDVCGIQYRGNGWPSGIQIKLKDGTVIKRDNYTYPWTLMHQSLLFRPKRCLLCPMKISADSDIALADPWLKEYEGKDIIGNSFLLVNSPNAETIFEEMKCNGLLSIHKVKEERFVESQKGSILIKQELAKHKKFYRFVSRLGGNYSMYKKFITSSPFLLKVHCYLISKIQYKILL